MGWLADHLENFVKPVLGEIPNRPALHYFSPFEMSLIKNTWRACKQQARGRPIILPGRDVFVFEILARREDYPTLFLPNCSRATVRYMRLEEIVRKNYLLFDTGFVGSIPKGLGVKRFKLLSFEGSDPSAKIQVFPWYGGSRALALKIESTPKYWETAKVGEGLNIIQPISERRTFKKAAQLTIEVYTSSAPKFVPGSKLPKRGSIW